MKLENESIFRDIIDDIKEDLEDTIKEDDSEFKQGKLLAYNEILSNIQRQLRAYDLKALGLDFDIDEKILNSKDMKLDAKDYNF
ncbi:MAG: hypothetical protein E7205_11095 [Tissierellaceae bacterium]|jgi:hypothetical protein|nr:hypothetical protein [Tissierellaceae bacterium]